MTQVSEQLASVLAEMAKVTNRIEELEEKLHAVLVEWTKEREDLTGERDEVHRRAANEISRFVSQKVQALAYMAAAHHNSSHYSQKNVGQLIAKLTVCYLGPSNIDLRRARRLIRARQGDERWIAAGNAATQAKAILSSLRVRGVEFVWDYEFDQDFPLDDSRQQPWSTCDPDGDVAFVVTPAYIADGECYLRQQVFTVSTAAG
ncbi:hypothetical protein [Kitasatospora sp. NPDC001175]|uniref:hypothetical protein n=1 Tax=Kitasatospora sp. NPDC001175 TaxID=3157103 RepID=UPI003D07F7E2